MAKVTAASEAQHTNPGPGPGTGSSKGVTSGNVLVQLLSKPRPPSRPLLMGVLNVTPDSFSDGGQFLEPPAAIERARQLAADGADIIDIGAESTRPYGGMRPVTIEEERARLEPILPAAATLGVPVSIDTMKAQVAAWALEAGATIVNDVWGLQRDPDMARVIAEHGAPIVIMHNRDTADPNIDIIADVTDFFSRSLEIAWAANIAHDRIVLDPGIGFGKTSEQSLTCIARLHEWRGFDLPLLIGASRKRFINAIVPSNPGERLGGSLAAHLIAAENGAAILRVHDVAPTAQALAVAAAIRSAR
ncbi:MAG: dihydropteroate synthase [Xanthobacteraceae bacterium]